MVSNEVCCVREEFCQPPIYRRPSEIFLFSFLEIQWGSKTRHVWILNVLDFTIKKPDSVT